MSKLLAKADLQSILKTKLRKQRCVGLHVLKHVQKKPSVVEQVAVRAAEPCQELCLVPLVSETLPWLLHVQECIGMPSKMCWHVSGTMGRTRCYRWPSHLHTFAFCLLKLLREIWIYFSSSSDIRCWSGRSGRTGSGIMRLDLCQMWLFWIH